MKSKTTRDRINEFREYVDCCGLYKIIDNDVFAKINALGYFDAPASTKYHLAYEGGLYEHSSAIHKYPNVLWTHQADMYATHVMEVKK